MASRDRDGPSAAAQSMRARWRRWFLLDGNRLVVTGVIALSILVIIAIATVSGAVPLRNLRSLDYLFGALVGGNVTIITVVVAINQLLLSRELATPEELRSQMEGVVDYRRDVEERTGQIMPVEPLGFLRLLFENTRQAAQSLGGLARSVADDPAYDEIDPVVAELTADADRVLDLLDASDASTFRVLSATLTTNYARQINELRRIRAQHAARLPPAVDERIAELVENLHFIEVARQYFKSIYTQEELATLSKLLVYVGVASITVVALHLLALTADAGVALPDPYLTVAVPVVTTVGLLPISLLLSYIVRTATVTKRTAATIPFTTPAQEH